MRAAPINGASDTTRTLAGASVGLGNGSGLCKRHEPGAPAIIGMARVGSSHRAAAH